MRPQYPAKNGIGADKDMLFYWRFTETDINTKLDHKVNEQLITAISKFPLTREGTNAGSNHAQSIYNSVGVSKWMLNTTTGSVAFRTTTGGLEYHAKCLGTNQDTPAQFTFCLWMENYMPGLSTATQTLLEYSNGLKTAAVDNLGIGLYYTVASSQVYLQYAGNSMGGPICTVLCPTPLTTGFVAVSFDETDPTNIQADQFKWYVNGEFVGTATAFGGMGGIYVGTNTSARWSVGDSIYHATGWNANSPFGCSYTKIGEVAAWPAALPPTAIRQMYRNCIKDWDDSALWESNPKVVTRVILEDGLNVDLSNLVGTNHVASVEITRDVDSDAQTASISLFRRVGELQDLSPLSTTTEFSQYIKLRRRLRIERAVVPHLRNVESWMYETVFVGFIDSWEFNENTVDIKCTDLSAALEDAQVFENRAYNFYTAPKPMGEHINEIIADYEPIIPGTSGASGGYVSYVRNYPPRAFTPSGYLKAGSIGDSYMEQDEDNLVTSPNWNLNYNDVPSGSVRNAIKAVADQIGWSLGFEYHPPLNYPRLTIQNPLRDNLLAYTNYSGDIWEQGTTQVGVKFNTPHGLGVGARVSCASISAAAPSSSLVGNYYVTAVTSTYHALLEADGHTVTSGASLRDGFSISRSYTTVLAPHEVKNIAPLNSDITDIRNYCSVRYKRENKEVEDVIGSIRVFGSRLYISMNSENYFRAVDPDRTGISFTVASYSTSSLNGKYTGTLEADGVRLVSSEPTVVADGVYANSNGLGVFISEYIKHRETEAYDINSITKYGVRPCAIYEGSNMAIDTLAEAQRLADAIVSDLSEPSANVTLTCPVKPIEINDLIVLPPDPKRRYEDSARTVCVTGITERYSSGQSEMELRVRFNAIPTNGVIWAQGMLVDSARPAGAGTYTLSAADMMASVKPRYSTASSLLRVANAIPIVRSQAVTSNSNSKASMRKDETIVYLSTSCAGFIPTSAEKAASFRGENFDLTNGPDGLPLTPGTTYYVKVAQKDVFNNMSQISGVGVASSATVFAVVPRFTTQHPSVRAVRGTTASAYYLPTTYTPTGIFNSTASPGFDIFGNYNTSSAMFTMPCDGVVTISGRALLRSPNSSGVPTTKAAVFSGSLTLKGVSAPISFGGVNDAYPSYTPCVFTHQVTASSGDLIRVDWFNSVASNTDMVACTPASVNSFPYLHFHVMAQN